MHLLLWLIFRQSYPNFINVRTAYASKIWTQHLAEFGLDRPPMSWQYVEIPDEMEAEHE